MLTPKEIPTMSSIVSRLQMSASFLEAGELNSLLNEASVLISALYAEVSKWRDIGTAFSEANYERDSRMMAEALNKYEAAWND